MADINPETKFVLNLWGVEQLLPVEEMLISNPDSGVCLVDHQQTSQLNPAIEVRLLNQN